MSLKNELQSITTDEATTAVRGYIAKRMSDNPEAESDIDALVDTYPGPGAVVEEFMDTIEKSNSLFSEEELEMVSIGASMVVAIICEIAEVRELPSVG